MENNDHSKTKLLNKNIKVTDKDIYEFNAWIKGKKITPKLMEEFDDVSDYEDFMYDYDPTENYSVALIEFDKPETYGKGSEGYEYLSSVDKATYDQIIANLAKNDLKIEYDDNNDEFRIYSDVISNSDGIDLEVGEYCNNSDTYKKLSSLDQSGYESLMGKIKNKLNVEYNELDDKFLVTKTESMNYPIEPGVYKSDTKEYKKLDRLVDDEWTDYLDELAKYGLAIEYDNLNDSFVVTGSDNFSKNMSAELGENSYMLVRYDALDPDFDSWYFDLMSELNPDFERLDKLPIGKSIKTKDWKITKLSDPDSLEFTYSRYVTEFANSKMDSSNFSDDMTEVTFRTTNPKKLTEIVNAIGECGNGGHTFDIIIDPDLTKGEGGDKKFQWDGDGSDRVEITKSYSQDREKVSAEILNDKSLSKSIKELSKEFIDLVDDLREGVGSQVALEVLIKEAYDYIQQGDNYKSFKEYHELKGDKRFSNLAIFSENREKASAEMLEKAKTDGVIQKKPNGKWGIISIDAGEWWNADYDSRENAEAALAAYHANKSNKERTSSNKRK